MNKLVVKAFTNELGQEIQPGDPVVYVGSGYNHSVTIRRGTFSGVYEETYKPYDYKSRTYGEAVTRVTAVRIDGVEGQRWVGNYVEQPDGSLKYVGGNVPVIRHAILPRKRVFKIDETTLDNLIGKSF